MCECSVAGACVCVCVCVRVCVVCGKGVHTGCPLSHLDQVHGGCVVDPWCVLGSSCALCVGGGAVGA